MMNKISIGRNVTRKKWGHRGGFKGAPFQKLNKGYQTYRIYSNKRPGAYKIFPENKAKNRKSLT